MSYKINFTDKTKAPILIDDANIDNTTDITLFGRTRLAYGEELQQNLLHILENFACPEDPLNPGNPDVSRAVSGVFTHVVAGQCWYNSTSTILYYYDGAIWIPMAAEQSVAANWGSIADGQYLPKPISSISNRVYDYPQCVYIVSPQTFPQKIDYMVCEADTTGLVTMQYRIAGTDNIVGGVANYLIVGILGNVNQPAPTLGVTPTPTPTPTSSVGNSATPTPTVKATSTPAASVSPTRTPAATPTKTPATSITPTPTPSSSVAAPTVLPFQGQTLSAYAIGEAYCPSSGSYTAEASVGLVFNSDGTYTVSAKSFPGTSHTGIQTGTWLPPSWSVSDTEIQFTGVVTLLEEVNTTISNSATTYTSLSNSQVYSTNSTVKCGGARGQGSSIALTISLKRISTGVVVNTSCTIVCDVASGV